MSPPETSADLSPAERSGSPEAGDPTSPAPPRVSVIVPALNEAPNMPELFTEMAETFRSHDLDAEVVLVDDGSTDGTLPAAREAAEDADLDRVVYRKHRQNRGKTEALLTAARAARGEHLVLFDADLQHSPEEIPRFIGELDTGFDVVTGRKVGDYQKPLVSSLYNWLCRVIFGVPAHDLNSMKAFRRQVLEDIRLRKEWHRYLVVLAHAQGYRVSEIDIELYPRRRGESKYTGQWRILVGLLDLITVWFQVVCSRKPMLFFGVTGLGLFTLGGTVGAVALYFRFVLGQGYRPLLTLVVLLMVLGVLLFAVGFLAELMATLRHEIEDLRRDLRR